MKIALLILVTLITAAACAVWRRAFGGDWSLSKTFLRFVGCVVFSGPAWYAWHSGDAWFTVGYSFAVPIYAKSVVVMLSFFLQMSLGDDFTNFWPTVFRYEIGPALLIPLLPWAIDIPVSIFASGLLMSIGPLTALVYNLAFANKWSISTPFDSKDEKFIDAPNACGELAVGWFNGMSYAIVPLFPLLLLV